MEISLAQAADLLCNAKDILIIAHKSPDGDTLGSSFALCHALTARGLRARVECSDPIPEKYGYLLGGAQADPFAPQFVAAVDVADPELFGLPLEKYKGCVDLCLDHHQVNKDYARCRYIDPGQAATAQIVHGVLREMGAALTPLIADCLFTGITTDTGCFRYTNVTAATHRIAAELMEHGARGGEINRLMFEQKTGARVQAEIRAMQTLAYDFNGRCAMICISQELMRDTGAGDDDLDGVSAMPRQIEGVWIGVTFRERADGFKISMRTDRHLDASALCAALGGGGHKRAAGCFVPGDLDAARARVRAVIGAALS